MTNLKQIKLKVIQPKDRLPYLNYLLLADENEVAVNKYLHDGDMYAIYSNDEVVGTLLSTYQTKQIVELKNMALAPEYRNKGLGSFVINEMTDLYKVKGVKKIRVGTANSSIGNIVFYQKNGFRMDEIRRDFFKDYPAPIYENGIRALDMIMFEKDITDS
ncbi:GNAT family N-acetyltransferase [Amphibacillus sp. Q70]|uniref:GNAT family N-acetyltransferase n=1 Tax=Amphibacillus sp. Q70 TaxID=3453416 RepID=UPI003F8241BA